MCDAIFGSEWPLRQPGPAAYGFWRGPASSGRRASCFRQIFWEIVVRRCRRCNLIGFDCLTSQLCPRKERLVEPGVKRRRGAAHFSPRVAVAESDVATASGAVWAVIDLIVGAAAIGTDVVTINSVAMVLILWRQRRHRNPAVGELLDQRRSLQFDRCNCRRCHGEQHHAAHQRPHPAISL